MLPTLTTTTITKKITIINKTTKTIAGENFNAVAILYNVAHNQVSSLQLLHHTPLPPPNFHMFKAPGPSQAILGLATTYLEGPGGLLQGCVNDLVDHGAHFRQGTTLLGILQEGSKSP